jgi:hypothetical protein
MEIKDRERDWNWGWVSALKMDIQDKNFDPLSLSQFISLIPVLDPYLNTFRRSQSQSHPRSRSLFSILDFAVPISIFVLDFDCITEFYWSSIWPQFRLWVWLGRGLEFRFWFKSKSEVQSQKPKLSLLTSATFESLNLILTSILNLILTLTLNLSWTCTPTLTSFSYYNFGDFNLNFFFWTLILTFLFHLNFDFDILAHKVILWLGLLLQFWFRLWFYVCLLLWLGLPIYVIRVWGLKWKPKLCLLNFTTSDNNFDYNLNFDLICSSYSNFDFLNHICGLRYWL